MYFWLTLKTDPFVCGCCLYLRHRSRTILKMPGNDGDGTRTSTSQSANSACQRSAFDVLSSRPREVSKPTNSGRAHAGSSGSKGRPYAWYFKHFEPVEKEKYPDDAIDLVDKKGRLFQDKALMACKMCKVHLKKKKDARFTCRHTPSTTLGNHLLMACEGFQESAHWRDPEEVQKVASMAMKVIFCCLHASFAFHVPCEQCGGALTTQLPPNRGMGCRDVSFKQL
jgi:hypothetical protein